MESIRRGFVCMSEQKFHSYLIKAARVVTHQDVLNTFFSVFVLHWLCCLSSLLPLSFPPVWREKWIPLLLLIPPYFALHLICMNGTILFTPPILSCCCRHSLLPPLSKVCALVPLAKTPSHCKRMSLSQRKQSAFIMSYLPGPPWQRVMIPGRGESVFGVKDCGSEE